MGMMFEKQAVVDCLTNTAKYYDMPNADKWTKGIHYGLLHGLDNILDNVKPVDAIPRDQYEVRLKADMVDILDKIRSDLHYDAEMHEDGNWYLRIEWMDEVLDKYESESEEE